MKKLLIIGLTLLIAATFWWKKDYLAEAHRFWKPTPETAFRHLKTSRLDVAYLSGTPVAKNIKTLAGEVEKNLVESESQLNMKLNETLHVYIYNTFEEKGAHIRNIQLAHADVKEATIYFIWNQTFDGIAERAEWQILLYEKFGRPADQRWSRAVAAAMAQRWNHKSLDDWNRFLSTRNLIPDWNLLNANADEISEFIAIPYSAMIANEVRKTYGDEALVELYRSGTLPEEFQYTQNRNSGIVPAMNRRKSFTPEFQRGMTYAYWNSTDAGYAAEKSRSSLGILKKSGVAWIASIPYGYMETHDSTEIRMASHNIFAESDESMFQLALDARQLGIKVMLKPQIWISHEAWPGKIKMNSHDDWGKWFDNYEQWIIHYALIAELSNADLFCIGTELVETTLQHPQRWRKLIAKIRQVYSGPLVYAANWGKEFEGITFWDALDYIGLDNYYPVRQTVDDNAQVMREGFHMQKLKLKALATRWQKPLLFTEIGYMANEGAGMGSREDQYTKYDEQMQAECYKLALETYWNEPWFAGMYWWKWFSNPDDRGARADAHSPHGRKSGAILTEWYNKPRQTETVH